ncbi:class I SAM-dependent methyltransferase [Phenylobacterium sp.]|jgi:SAM-dependent methyltransferase|uniref:class I SAM-dependent methyltransferase n=1 Tax=Phenylobacterium sp. TaxID=1871053 RepID=UPI002F93ACF7
MSGDRDYYAEGSLSAEFYDLVTAADGSLAGDLELYAGLAPTGGSVLELGAGSGRLTFALAALGFWVTGVEISATMLAKARSAAAAARVELLHADMTALDLGRTFDLVLCPFFTLAHVAPEPGWRDTFQVAARHLRPGGRAAFHLPLRRLMALPPPDPGRVVFDRPLPGGGRLQLHIRDRAFDDASGRLDQRVDYVERGPGGEVRRRSTERLTYHVADPRPFAEAAALASEGPPIPLGGAGQVWVFRRP